MKFLCVLAIGVAAASAHFHQLAPRNVMVEEAAPVYMANCASCCPVTIRKITVKETYYSTDTETVYKTATEHDVSTQLQYTTQFVTKTQVSTFTTSYPVTVTSLINCTKNPGPIPTYLAKRIQDTYGPPEAPLECETVTTTEWKTVTSTNNVVSTKTVLVPTISVVPTTLTDIETVTQTRNQSVTVWVPTTYTATITRTSQYPVTVTKEHGVTVTNTATTTETVVTTLTTSYPVVSDHTVTQPAVTITQPGAVVTQPAVTITQSGSIVTQPAVTITQPASIITQPGTTVTAPAPAQTAATISICPAPVGGYAPLDPKSDLTFGCSPGTVCSPPMPDDCNAWPAPPSDGFLCCESDCIPSPPYTLAHWRENDTNTFPLSFGYFNLDPRAFGLSYDVFRAPEHGRRSAVRRETTPPMCYDDCNNAYLVAESVGKTDALCHDGSSFNLMFDTCQGCIAAHSNGVAHVIDSYVQPVFAQFLNFCHGRRSVPTTPPVAVSPGGSASPEPVVSPEPVATSSQAEASPGSFEPVPTTPETSPSPPTDVTPSVTAVDPTTNPESTQDQTNPPESQSSEATLPKPSEESSITSNVPNSISSGSTGEASSSAGGGASTAPTTSSSGGGGVHSSDVTAPAGTTPNGPESSASPQRPSDSSASPSSSGAPSSSTTAPGSEGSSVGGSGDSGTSGVRGPAPPSVVTNQASGKFEMNGPVFSCILGCIIAILF